MRTVSDDLGIILGASHQVHTTADIVLGGVVLFRGVPISAGALSVDATRAVPASADITVPRYGAGPTGQRVDLLPTTAGSPLGCDGHRLVLSYQVGAAHGTERVPLGHVRVQSWAQGGAGIDLACTGLEALIDEARFLAPVHIPGATAYADAARQLLGGLLPVAVTAAPGVTGAGIDADNERLGALQELLLAWGARTYISDNAVLMIAPAYDDGADPLVWALCDGEGGTVVHVPSGGSRDGVYNAVRASGEQDGDFAPVSAIAYTPSGPRAWNGPYGNVPYFYSSPLLTTNDQAAHAARTRLAALSNAAAPVEISAAPDPRLQPGDMGVLTWAGASRVVRIDATVLPLTAGGGAMTITGHTITTRTP
jgi:hypothetical protein